MERNNLVLYLDIPEFSEALYASKWHPDAVLPQAGDNIHPESCCQKRYLPCWRQFPPARSGKT